LLNVVPTAIADVRVLTPRRISDARGYFSEVFSRAGFAAAGIDIDFVQENHSLSRAAGTVRGLHFQAPPCAHHKLIRVVRGRVLDVALDIRRSSPTFRRHVAVELSAENGRQILVPIGFAHGLCTLEPDTEVIYKVSAPYAPACDIGIAWDDPTLGIAWPVAPGAATLSPRDRCHPKLGDLPVHFE
jgi:dTDP-4-dehydrorhamnose 3,5-epimerase